MTKLIVIGAGNIGGYLAYNVKQLGDYEIVGFLDDDLQKQGKEIYGVKVLGTTDCLEKIVNDGIVHSAIAIATPAHRMSIVTKIAHLPLIYPNLISPKVWISEGVSIGKGVILYPGVSINYETAVNDFVIVNMNCAIGHNCSIGSCSSLAPGVNLGGFTSLEAGVSMGIGSATRQNIHVGKGAIIGGQAMLVSNVQANEKVIGVPARVSQA